MIQENDRDEEVLILSEDDDDDDDILEGPAPFNVVHVGPTIAPVTVPLVEVLDDPQPIADSLPVTREKEDCSVAIDAAVDAAIWQDNCIELSVFLFFSPSPKKKKQKPKKPGCSWR